MSLATETTVNPPPRLELEAAPAASPRDHDAGGAAAPAFDARRLIAERCAVDWRWCVASAWFVGLFVYFSYIPLFHTDLWCHVHYGEWMLTRGALPTEDPFMPLAQGVRVIDSAWLARIGFALAHRLGGPQGLSILFAVTALATHLLYFRVFHLLSGRVAVALLASALLLFVGFSRHAIIRPEMFGGLLLASLFFLLTWFEPWKSRLRHARAGAAGDPGVAGGVAEADEPVPLWLWLAIPALFAVWANLHGTFVVGLLTLGCHAAGRALEVAWRRGRPWEVFADAPFRRFALLTQLAAAATLCNPHGVDLLVETARFGSNPNLRDVLEWYPLKLIDLEGIQFAASLVLMLFVLRHSRAAMRPVDVLLLLAFGCAVAPAIRMIGWYAPVLCWVLTPHLADVWRRWRGAPGANAAQAAGDGAEPARSAHFAFTLACVVLLWCGFALTPVSQPLLGGRARPREKVLSRDTPHGVTAHLRAHPPQGLVFNPQWWGDWLVWDGPPGLQPFVTTNLHLAPAQVWKDYLRIARGNAGWEGLLDRYRCGTLIIHKELQPDLTRAVRGSPQWRRVYEDKVGMVLERVGEG